jgi:hypothetical protein
VGLTAPRSSGSYTTEGIARFEELRDRAFAEYYLVGTLASVLVAVASGLAVRALV